MRVGQDNAEQVRRVVLLLDAGELRVVGAVRHLHAILLVGGEEVHVHGAGRERGQCLEQVPSPGDALAVVRRRVPPAVHVDEEVGLAVRIGGGVVRNALDRAAQLSERHLRLRVRQPAGEVRDDVDHRVRDLQELV
jgi:hypothetical protein